MTVHPALPAPAPTRRLPPWLTATAAVLLLNTLIAALLTVLDPPIGGFARNLLFSQCIGLSVFGLGMAVRALRPIGRLAPAARVGVAIGLAAPLGSVCGYALAYTLLGEPVRLLSTGPGRAVAILATVLGSGFVGYLMWLRQRLAQEAAQRARAQQLAAESELRLLRAQIEPHMLFNTLANLHSLVDDDPGLAKVMLDRLIVYLRAALAASRSEWVTLAQEYAQLDAYLGIMAVRLGARLDFTLRLPDELAGVRVPPMLLQPLVENAIKHGIEPKIGGGRVDVEARRGAAGEVALIVTDTGLGLASGTGDAAPPDADRGHYGLAHVRERLRAVYGGAAAFELGPGAPHGTRACVRIPA
ncbi:MAG TPA: histidine kinase [Ottowia sp.]|mgnify:CR=1 FL=1|uniref:sensor histidine kinase n=1 Tax=Ottowia sp. TaxID=1898956 RepID=UPI002C16658F|nr:histidine kinase [Ottowia sp.]HMN22446.1 histidine kinase [Ottowia sp.]